MSAQRKIPRRDLTPLWASGGWLYWALCGIVFAAMASSALAAAICAAPVIPFSVIGIRKYLRTRKAPAARLRRELLAVLRSLPEGDGWLNRDEHALFACQVRGLPGLRVVTVAQLSEDDLQTPAEEGMAHAVAYAWEAWPWEPQITRTMHGATVTDNGTGKVTIEAARTGIVRYLRANRAARKAGVLHATDDEVRELTAMLRTAEPVFSREES